MGIIIIVVVAIVIGAIIQARAKPHEVEYKEDEYPYHAIKKTVTSTYGAYIMGGAILLLVIAYLGMNIGNLGRKAYLESFYNNNASVYQVAADKTATYLSTDKFTTQIVAGSLDTMQLATTISQRIAEWRDNVANYNLNLQGYRIYQSNFWFNVFMPSLPDNIKPLAIQ